MSITSETDKTVVEPLAVTPELNVERIQDELSLQLTVGKNINWDNYKVIINGTEIKTEPGKISSEGDIVYFDYKGGLLVDGLFYNLIITDLKANIVVYDEEILAIAIKPEGTGIYGYVTSAKDGSTLANFEVTLFKNGQLMNISDTEFSDTYKIHCEEGSYELVCKYILTSPDIEYKDHRSVVNVTKYNMLRYDIVLELVTLFNSKLEGHIYNNATGNPIIEVDIKISDYKTYQDSVKTDSNGYYKFNLQPLNFTIICDIQGYVLFRADVQLEENETITLDIYLDPIPPQTAVLKGNVYDKKSGEPIVGEDVFTVSPYLTNSTLTNATGYFQINVVPGDVTAFINIVGYKLWEQEISVADYENYLLPPIYLVQEPGGG
jgi:hypothetical protein